jgi:hypothetical protein
MTSVARLFRERVLEALKQINFGQEDLTAISMTGQKEIRVAVNDIPSAEEMRSEGQGRA